MEPCPHCGRPLDDAARFCPFDGTPVAHLRQGSARELNPDDIVDGRYRVVAELGRGGIGIVYLARHETLGEVAIKVLQPQAAERQTTVARFAREARMSARFDHPNVVRVFEFGFDPAGFYFLVMELIEGRSLFDLLHAERCVAPKRALRLLQQIASGLARAHELGVIHRDLKAENVMLRTDDGEHITLMDFGLSRTDDSWAGAMRTAEGQLVGTPAYISPEQWTGSTADVRSDVYAFGVLAYEMLCGQAPLAGSTIMELMRAHVYTEPEPLLTRATRGPLPPGLGELVHQCLVKDPEKRCQSMSAVLDELQTIRDTLAQRISSDTIVKPHEDLHSGPVESPLPDDDLRAELWRVACVRRPAYDALVEQCFPHGSPYDISQLQESIDQEEGRLGKLASKLAAARAKYGEATRDQLIREAQLRGDLADAAIRAAAQHAPALASVAVDVVGSRDEREAHLAQVMREPDATVHETEFQLESLRAQFDGHFALLEQRYEQLVQRLADVTPPQTLEQLKGLRTRIGELRNQVRCLRA